MSTPTLLALTNNPFVGSAGTLSGTIQAAVYSDPLNTFGAGDLDFVYQITNSASSTDSISRVTAINFTGFSTDVGFTATGSGLGNGFVNGTVAPELVDRQSADVVGFTFNAPLTDAITPGATSTVLVIETNATHFTSGNVSVIDGSVITVPAFSPTAVPEMSSVTLLGLGLVCLGGVAVARKKFRIVDICDKRLPPRIA